MNKLIYKSIFYNLFITVFSYFFSIISLFLLSPIFTKMNETDFIWIFTIITTLIVDSIGCFIFYKKEMFQLKEEFKVPNQVNFFWKYIWLFSILCFINVLYITFLNFIHYDMSNYTNTFNNQGWIGILYVCIIAPIVEECIYRGMICKSLKKYGNLSAILISSFLFSFMHLTIEQLIPTFFAGIILGYFYVTYNNLWIPILFHVLNNIFASLNIPDFLSYLLIILGIISLIYLIVKYRKNRKDIYQKIKKTGKEMFQIHLCYLYVFVYLMFLLFPYIIEFLTQKIKL